MYLRGSTVPVKAKVVDSSGGAITSGVVAYHITGTTRSVGQGTLTHVANGLWNYSPTAAETGYDEFAIEFAHANAVGGGPIVWVVTGTNTGSGPYTLVATVKEGTVPIEGADVRLTLGAEQYWLRTDADGKAVFHVGAGTWQWRVAKPGYMGQSATVAVSGDKQFDVGLEKVVVSPSPPGQTTGYAIVYDEQGAVEPDVTVYCRLVQLNVYGVVGDTQERSAQSNQQGVVEFPGLVKGATYAFRRSNGVERMLRVPLDAGDTIELPPLMGKE